MLKRLMITVLCGVTATVGLSMVTVAPQASAATCSDVSLVFARGTAEPAAPLGITGASFAQALRGELRGKSLSVTGLNYPASANFNNRLAFGRTVVDGVTTLQNSVKSLAANCPRTRIVVGGYSQGAVVTQYAISPRVTLPAEYARFGRVVSPLPASIANRVAAVVLFAPPSARFLSDARAPGLTVSPQYQAKTLRYCIAGDNICNGARLAGPNALHVLYSVNGDTINAARKVVGRL